jgi:hypothetical protein
MSEEPSVLDYLKISLRSWLKAPFKSASQEAGGYPLRIQDLESQRERILDDLQPDYLQEAVSQTETAPISPALPAVQVSFPWRSLFALAIALVAQSVLEPPVRFVLGGALLYLIAGVWAIAAALSGEWELASHEDEGRTTIDRGKPSSFVVGPSPSINRRSPANVIRHPIAFLSSVVLSLLAFFAFGGNRFTAANVTIWVAALGLLFYSLWQPQPGASSRLRRLGEIFSKREWNLKIKWGTVAVFAVAALVLFFRFYHLAQVPSEMTSDHAEKLLDVWDVLNGKTSIFFPRNTGREAIQFYLTAAAARYLGTGISFLSLKLGVAVAGLAMLVYLYLLGKEVGNRRVGLLCVLFAGIAYWTNVITRMGLRFSLYPLFVAPTLFYLIRGMRRSSRNDFLLAGLALGLGLHGYTPFRIVPFVVVAGVVIFLLHGQSSARRWETLRNLALLALVALFVFLPLMRYALDNPDQFAFRAFSRVGAAERPLPGPVGQLLLQNIWNGLRMFNWDDGEIWSVSIPHRPALDVISGALFLLGTILLLARYLRRRHWLDLFLILSVPMFMLPSILSLAFPSENPALNRAAGALVPVFLILALAMDGLMSGIEARLGPSRGPLIAYGLALLLIVFAARQNYDLVFHDYQNQYEMAAWNTSEMGAVIRDFVNLTGDPDSAWVVVYPYWVDTRLVGMIAGFPTKDYALWPEQLSETTADKRAKLFLIKPEDETDLLSLQQMYPTGTVQTYASEVENHNFLMFFVPPEK